ncbi:MAG: phospholipase [Synechococcaceae cyanobacterium SM2_3_2]|nr:phospholipase [Synechococcaceae cyanobacterium SM2_3_2]
MLPLVHRTRQPQTAEKLQKAEGSPPILLMLHGVGSHEEDLLGLASYLDPRFYVVSVRAPRPYQAGGFSWFDLTWTETGVTGDPQQALESLELLRQFVDGLRQSDPQLALSPLYVMGFSQGAMMSLLLTLRFPPSVQGAVIMSGRWPTGLEVDPSAELGGLPLLVVHGTQDRVLSIAEGREIRRQLQRLPVDLSYSEFEMGHEVSSDSLLRIRDWLTQQLVSIQP